MNKDYVYFDQQVDKFLRNQMSEEEATAFMSELSSDVEKKERARIIALMIKSMDKVGIERDRQIVNQIRGLSKAEFKKLIGIKPTLISLFSKAMKYGIAACVVCILTFGGYKYYYYQQTVSLGNAEYYAYVADINLEGSHRGDNANIEIESKLLILFSNVKNVIKISAAIKELESIYEEALSEESLYNNYVDDIAWNLAIAYLKDGNREKPLILLEDMIKRNEGYSEITLPAKELIKKINNL